jgi:dTDP-4-dehydrorhamnose 3,5-epimerase
MDFESTTIADVVLIKPKYFGDERGYFMETYQQERYAEHGIPNTFVQDNVSFSQRGVLRGLHWQSPHEQGKLVSVLYGEVFDVVVDIRPDSPSFGKWVGRFLSAQNHYQLWVPPGLAHGFCVTSKDALFSYKCTDFYAPAAERCIRWDDKQLNIDWPLKDVLVSEKDRLGLSFEEAVHDCRICQ